MGEKANFGDEEKGLERMKQALQSKPDDAACRTCLNQLDNYISAQLGGEDYVSRFPDVALHLDICLDCAGAYARLYELELADTTNQLPLPDQHPDPDLSFLTLDTPTSTSSQIPPDRAKVINLSEQLRWAIRYTSERLTLQFSAELLAILQPSPKAALTRSPTDSERYGQVLLSFEPAMTPNFDWPITLTAYQDTHQPHLCLVEVVVMPAGQSWPDLADRTVTLILAGEKREVVTDAWGLASFADVNIDDLADARLIVTLTN